MGFSYNSQNMKILNRNNYLNRGEKKIIGSCYNLTHLQVQIINSNYFQKGNASLPSININHRAFTCESFYREAINFNQ